jgi:hypothetical protein
VKFLLDMLLSILSCIDPRSLISAALLCFMLTYFFKLFTDGINGLSSMEKFRCYSLVTVEKLSPPGD